MSQPLRLKSWFAAIEPLEGLTEPGVRLYGLLDAEDAEGMGGELPVGLDLVERLADDRARCVVEGKERIVELLGVPELERARTAGVSETHLETFANGIPSHIDFSLQAAACSRVDLSAAFPPTPSTSATPYPFIQNLPIDLEEDDEALPSSLFDLGTGYRLDEGAPKTRHELAQALRDVKGKARAHMEEEPVHLVERDEGYEERDDDEANEEDWMEVDEREPEPMLDGPATSTPSAGVDGGEKGDPGGEAPITEGQSRNANRPDDAPPRPAPSPAKELPSSHALPSPSSSPPKISSPLRLTTVLPSPASIPSSRIVAASTKIAIHAFVSEFFGRPLGSSLHSNQPSLLVFSRREQDLLDAVSQPLFKPSTSDQAVPGAQAQGQGEAGSPASVVPTSAAGVEQLTEAALPERHASPSSVVVLPNGDSKAIQPEPSEEDNVLDVEYAVEKDAGEGNEASVAENAVEKVPLAEEVEDQRQAPYEAGPPVEAEEQPAQEDVEMIEIEETYRSATVQAPSPKPDVLGPVQLPPPPPAAALSDRHSSLEPLPHPTSSFASFYEESEGGDSVDLMAKELAEFVERDALGLVSSEPDESYKTARPDKAVTKTRTALVELTLEKVEQDVEEQEGEVVVPESPRQSPSPQSEEMLTPTKPPSTKERAEPFPEPVPSPVVTNDPVHRRSQSSASSYATAPTDSAANNASAALVATPAPSPRPHGEVATVVTEPVEEIEQVEEMEQVEPVEEIEQVEEVEQMEDVEDLEPVEEDEQVEQVERAAISNRSVARKAPADLEDLAPVDLPSPFFATAQLPPVSITEADGGSDAAFPLDREPTPEPQPGLPALQAEPAEVLQDAVNDLTQEVTGEVVGQVIGGLVEQVAGEAIGEVMGTVAGDLASAVVEGSGVVEGVSSALERAAGVDEEAGAEKRGSAEKRESAEKGGAGEAKGEERVRGVEDEVQGEKKEAEGEEEAPNGDVVAVECEKQNDFVEANGANGPLGEDELAAVSIVEAPQVAAQDEHAQVSPVEQPAPLPVHLPGWSPMEASMRDDEARRIAREASASNARAAMAALKALRNETTSPDLGMSYRPTDDFGGGGEDEDEERLPDFEPEAFFSPAPSEEQKYDVFGPVDLLPSSHTPAQARLCSSSAKSSLKPSPVPAVSSEPAQPPAPSSPVRKQLKRRRSTFLGVEIVVSPKKTPASPKKTFKHHAAQVSSVDPAPQHARASSTSRPSEHPRSRSSRSLSPPPPSTAKPTPEPPIASTSASLTAPTSTSLATSTSIFPTASTSTSLIAAVGRSFWDDAPAKTSRRSPLKYGARRAPVRSAQESPIDAGHPSSDALALSSPRASKTKPKLTPKPKASHKPAPTKKQQTAQGSRKGKGKAVVQAKESLELGIEAADPPPGHRKQPNPPQVQVEMEEPSEDEIIIRPRPSKGKGKAKAVVSDEGEEDAEDDEELGLLHASPSVSRKRSAPAPRLTASPSRKARKTRHSPPPDDPSSKSPSAVTATLVQPSSSFSSRKSRLTGLAQSRPSPATPANNHARSAGNGLAASATASGRPSRTRKPVEGWWEVQRGLESVARAHKRPRIHDAVAAADDDNDNDEHDEEEEEHGDEAPSPAAAIAPSPPRRTKVRKDRRNVIVEEPARDEPDDQQQDDSTNEFDLEGDELERDDDEEEGEEAEDEAPKPKPPPSATKRRKKRKSITLPRSRSRHRKPAVVDTTKQQSMSRASGVKKARGRGAAGLALLAAAGGGTTRKGLVEWAEGDESDGSGDVLVAQRENEDDDGYGLSD
ncbi:hypothetical protein JCM5296_006882 [Sporobolomyces johnsonii]